ncbi:asparaginase [Orenia marismortui]|uniref:asparaginase n=1 Tax=Orenia marismortui TaxID=46469 RepID=A0A4R8GZ30_9FIRM|nr:asparaginase [Orenia marismortui]TDX51689.1 L-asparaginase [Orenia marismortui]
MKKIKVITTGGTIAMGEDQNTHQIVPKLSGKDLLNSVPELNNIAELDLIQYSNLDSSQLTPKMILELSKLVKKALASKDISGVLITHGTDTLEETAYLLDLVLDTEKPVVITGALRSFNQLSSDGKANLVQSLQTIIEPHSKNKGVLVVLNNQIHAARFVSKIHTNKLWAFDSINTGSIGSIDHCGVHYFYNLDKQVTINTEELEDNVQLIKLAIGNDDRLIQASLDYGVKGLVLEAFGLGTLPKSIVSALLRAKKEEIPVVITSRCLEGRVYNLYGASTGKTNIAETDIIFAGNLNSTKARLVLMLLLGQGLSKNEIRQFFGLKLKM